ncbi:MAG: substrate-binding domain-containing protein [Synergistaceae bacterium]|jgi:tungstate transport system substrate-binding protein|nr:substrate-binding domain-containing protein [Synergistaceae bacterium]
MKAKRTGIRRVILAALAAIVLVISTGASYAAPVLKMATTTSTDNTGLLDYLAPIFLADTGIELQWVSVGTGKALEYGRNGDVDVVLTHDPESEKKFVDDGAGVGPRQVMYNDFVVLGPSSDPAGIKGKPVNEAFGIIALKSAPFASRADKSGTHMAELRIWQAAGVPEPDRESWYIQTGQGMLDTINIAGERDGYALADRGTFITYEASHKGNPPVVILVEGDETLKNQYSVIPVNPAKHANVNSELATKFADWLVSAKTQLDIANFKLEGKQLFFPNAK